MSEDIVIADHEKFNRIIQRLAYQIIENHNKDMENLVIIGLQPRGVYLANRISEQLKNFNPQLNIPCGFLDITFYRDDFRRKDYNIIPSATNIDFIVENKKVILMDDVLYTGRTIRAGLDALMAFGRPESVELMTLVDRRFKRNLPIQADYIGLSVDSLNQERVRVLWKEIKSQDQIILYRKKDNA